MLIKQAGDNCIVYMAVIAITNERRMRRECGYCGGLGPEKLRRLPIRTNAYEYACTRTSTAAEEEQSSGLLSTTCTNTYLLPLYCSIKTW